MEWHWYYLLGIAFILVHAWAFIATRNELPDEEIEQMWRDNF